MPISALWLGACHHRRRLRHRSEHLFFLSTWKEKTPAFDLVCRRLLRTHLEEQGVTITCKKRWSDNCSAQ